MARGVRDSEPDGIAGDVFYVLGMYDSGGGITTAELYTAVTETNKYLGVPVPAQHQVYLALRDLSHRKPPLVEEVTRGRWKQTAYAARMLDDWCGPLESKRVPCGLGWPP